MKVDNEVVILFGYSVLLDKYCLKSILSIEVVHVLHSSF
jgi:hypothetical protein